MQIVEDVFMLFICIFSEIISKFSVEELFIIDTGFAPETTCFVVEFQASADILLNSELNSFILITFS